MIVIVNQMAINPAKNHCAEKAMARNRTSPDMSDAARQFEVRNRLAAASPSNQIGTGLPSAIDPLQPRSMNIATGHANRYTDGS